MPSVEDRIEDRESPVCECGSSIFEQDRQGERHCADCGLVVQGEVDVPVNKPLKEGGVKPDEDDLGYLKIDTVCSHLNLPPSVINEVRTYFEMGYDQLLSREAREVPETVEGLAVGAIGLACRLSGGRYSRPWSRIIATSGITLKELRHSYRDLIKLLGVKVPAPKPEDYVPDITTALDLGYEIELQARNILARAPDYNFGKAPDIIAATATHLAAHICTDRFRHTWWNRRSLHPPTQAEFSDYIGISEVTFRNAGKVLRSAVGYHDNPENCVPVILEGMDLQGGEGARISDVAKEYILSSDKSSFAESYYGTRRFQASLGIVMAARAVAKALCPFPSGDAHLWEYKQRFNKTIKDISKATSISQEHIYRAHESI